jgi:tRNA (guanine-N7-)-methyltransferase
MSEEDAKPRRGVKSFVVRGGRLTRLQEHALATLSGSWVLPFSTHPLEFEAIFGNRPVVVEIGFGNGDATARIAETNPGIGYLGIEVFPAGVGNLLHEIDRRKLENLRIVRHDAVEVLRSMIRDASLSGVHLFFPDPWPKKRHHKRRIVNADFASLIASKLVPGGYLHAATDWEEYARWMLAVLDAEPMLENRSTGPAGYAPRAEWRPVTRFESKAGTEGREIREIVYFRRG